MALNNIPGMPTWTETATKIAHDYVDCLRMAAEADAVGMRADARDHRKAATRWKRLMDKYRITIRT